MKLRRTLEQTGRAPELTRSAGATGFERALRSRRRFLGRLLGAGAVAALTTPSFAAEVARRTGAHSVRDFGAAGDGATLDTQALQAAIDACAQTGGGTVFVPPGKYLTGSLFLKSRVTLHLDAGATLVGSKQLDD